MSKTTICALDGKNSLNLDALVLLIKNHKGNIILTIWIFIPLLYPLTEQNPMSNLQISNWLWPFNPYSQAMQPGTVCLHFIQPFSLNIYKYDLQLNSQINI